MEWRGEDPGVLSLILAHGPRDGCFNGAFIAGGESEGVGWAAAFRASDDEGSGGLADFDFTQTEELLTFIQAGC